MWDFLGKAHLGQFEAYGFSQNYPIFSYRDTASHKGQHPVALKITSSKYKATGPGTRVSQGSKRDKDKEENQ